MKTLELKNATRAETVRIRADEERENVLWFTIATERQASDGGILIARGMDAKEFLARPFVLNMHNPSDPMGRCIEIKSIEGGWEAAVERAPEDSISPEAARFWRFCRWAKFGAASIGFRCEDVDWEPKAEELAKYGATGRGWIGRKWKLLEWSLVTIQADPGALMKSDPFASIANPDERRAMRTALAFVGQRSMGEFFERETMSGTTTTNESVTIATQPAANTGTRAEDMAAVIEQLAKIEQMLISTNEKIDSQTAMIQAMGETENEEPEAEPVPEGEGQKAEKEFKARLDRIDAAFARLIKS